MPRCCFDELNGTRCPSLEACHYPIRSRHTPSRANDASWAKFLVCGRMPHQFSRPRSSRLSARSARRSDRSHRRVRATDRDDRYPGANARRQSGAAARLRSKDRSWNTALDRMLRRPNRRPAPRTRPASAQGTRDIGSRRDIAGARIVSIGEAAVESWPRPSRAPGSAGRHSRPAMAALRAGAAAECPRWPRVHPPAVGLGAD